MGTTWSRSAPACVCDAEAVRADGRAMWGVEWEAARGQAWRASEDGRQLGSRCRELWSRRVRQKGVARGVEAHDLLQRRMGAARDLGWRT